MDRELNELRHDFSNLIERCSGIFEYTCLENETFDQPKVSKDMQQTLLQIQVLWEELLNKKN